MKKKKSDRNQGIWNSFFLLEQALTLHIPHIVFVLSAILFIFFNIFEAFDEFINAYPLFAMLGEIK